MNDYRRRPCPVRRAGKGWIACLCLLACSGWAAVGLQITRAEAQKPSGDDEPVISIEVRNTPLGQVLDHIGRETGRHFTVAPEWESHPVTASLHNQPLGGGLKRILADLNHAIVYESKHEVRILIFGEVAYRPAGASPRPRPVPTIPFIEEEDGSRDAEADEAQEEPQSPVSESPREDEPAEPPKASETNAPQHRVPQARHVEPELNSY